MYTLQFPCLELMYTPHVHQLPFSLSVLAGTVVCHMYTSCLSLCQSWLVLSSVTCTPVAFLSVSPGWYCRLYRMPTMQRLMDSVVFSDCPVFSLLSLTDSWSPFVYHQPLPPPPHGGGYSPSPPHPPWWSLTFYGGGPSLSLPHLNGGNPICGYSSPFSSLPLPLPLPPPPPLLLLIVATFTVHHSSL